MISRNERIIGLQGQPFAVIECFKMLIFDIISNLNNDPVFQAFKENEVVGVSRKDNLVKCMDSFQQFRKVTFIHIFLSSIRKENPDNLSGPRLHIFSHSSFLQHINHLFDRLGFIFEADQ
jgi:hypothetical protein